MNEVKTINIVYRNDLFVVVRNCSY